MSASLEPAADDLPLDALDLPPGEVQRRFEWARRQGQPRWLWPDVSPDEWRRALAAIEAATKAALSGDDDGTATLDGDLAAIGLAAYTSGMGPLLGWWIERGVISADASVAVLLRLHLRHNRLRAERLSIEASRAAEILAAVGAAPTVLKGMHTAHAYFPEPGTRPGSDIDLLVPAERMAAAEDALRAAGFALKSQEYHPYSSAWAPVDAPALPRTLTLVHADDPWSLDVQTSLDRPFGGAGVARLNGLRATSPVAPWRMSEDATVLTQPLLTLFLAAHASASSLTLLRLTELVLVIRADTDRGALDWAGLVEAARSAGALRFIHPALALCDRLAPGTVPREVLAACDAVATPATRRFLAGVTPATAHSIDRLSMDERYMWADGWWARFRQLAYELGPAPAGYSLRRMLDIYRTRAWRLIRRTVHR